MTDSFTSDTQAEAAIMIIIILSFDLQKGCNPHTCAYSSDSELQVVSVIGDTQDTAVVRVNQRNFN